MTDTEQDLSYMLLEDAYASLSCGRDEPTCIKAAPRTFRKLIGFMLTLYDDDCLKCWPRYLLSPTGLEAWAPVFNSAVFAVDGRLEEGVIAFVNDKCPDDPKLNGTIRIWL